MPHSLPPLNALRVFEVAARAGSFTLAAHELHLTHGAVSRQVALLEAALGQPLFRKDGQRMVATEHAKAYAREISAAFDHIADASTRYGKRLTRQVVRINAPATFAMRWLIPKLDEFRQRHPSTEVNLSTAFSSDPMFKGSFDIAIRRSPAEVSQYEVKPLFQEWATPIASPTLVRRRRPRGPADLRSCTLLYTESRPGDWEEWLAAAGQRDLRAARQLRFDHFFVTLQAIVDGMGYGIGTFPTLLADRDANRICLPFEDRLVAGSTYFSIVPLDADKPRHLREFQAWLEACAATAAADFAAARPAAPRRKAAAG